jgi:hypothetical protein
MTEEEIELVEGLERDCRRYSQSGAQDYVARALKAAGVALDRRRAIMETIMLRRRAVRLGEPPPGTYSRLVPPRERSEAMQEAMERALQARAGRQR